MNFLRSVAMMEPLGHAMTFFSLTFIAKQLLLKLRFAQQLQTFVLPESRSNGLNFTRKLCLTLPDHLAGSSSRLILFHHPQALPQKGPAVGDRVDQLGDRRAGTVPGAGFDT